MNKAAVKISDPRGFKRICMNCGTRFYDMNKRPIVCPSCDSEFNNEMKLKGRKSRVSAAQEEAEGQVTKRTSKEAGGEDEDEIEEEPEDTEIVSLDDLETAETTDDDDALNVDLDDDDDDDLDDLEVDNDLDDLEDLDPDAELDEDDDEGDDKSKD